MNEFAGGRRGDIQKAFVRVARDSGYSKDDTWVADFVAELFGTVPFEIHLAIGDFETMEKIARGDHRLCREDI